MFSMLTARGQGHIRDMQYQEVNIYTSRYTNYRKEHFFNTMIPR